VSYDLSNSIVFNDLELHRQGHLSLQAFSNTTVCAALQRLSTSADAQSVRDFMFLVIDINTLRFLYSYNDNLSRCCDKEVVAHKLPKLTRLLNRVDYNILRIT